MKKKSLKMSMVTICNILAFSTPSNADVPTQCITIKANYMDAVNQFLLNAEALYNNQNYSSFTQFKNALSDAIQTLKSGNYTHPTLVTLESAIKASKYPKVAKDGVKELKKQTDSAGTRVKQWKNNILPTGQSCRNTLNCDLGQPTPKTFCSPSSNELPNN